MTTDAPARPTTIHLVPHTHWDREWYRPFQSFRMQLVDLVDRVLDMLEAEPAFAFTLDGQLATVDDYLEIRPEQEERLRRHAESGRLAIGPWQILMDEFLVSGETLVRNLEMGWARSEDFGGPMRIGYLPDMFGHVAQMPQILRRAGIEDAVVWRGVPAVIDRHAFRWEAPDGSWVRAEYLPAGYGNAADLFSVPEGVPAAAERFMEWARPWFGDDPVLAMYGTDHAAPVPELAGLVSRLNEVQEASSMEISTLAAYLASAPPLKADAPRWRGEMRSGARANVLMGVASARIDIKQAAGRAETLLERYAEPLTALHVAPEAWPTPFLRLAWRKVVENSAHDSICGCSVDPVVDQVLVRFAEAEQIAGTLARRAAAAVATNVPAGALTVLNPTPAQRVGPGRGDARGSRRVGRRRARAARRLAHRDPGARAQGARPARGHAAGGCGRRPLPPFPRPGDLRSRLERLPHRRAHAHPRGRHGPGPDLARRRRPAGRGDGRDARRARRRVAGSYPRPTAAHAGGVRARSPARLDRGPRGRGPRPCGARGSVEGRRPRPRERAPGRRGGGRRHPAARGLGRHHRGGSGAHRGRRRLRRLVQLWAASLGHHRRPTRIRHASRRTCAGPIRGRVTVTRAYDWPIGLAADGSARANDVRRTEVVTQIELRADEPFARVRVAFDNQSDDHRVRFHVPLARGADTSDSEGQFAVVQRPMTGEGGYNEEPLGTYPAHGWVDAGGMAILLRHLSEYELAASPGSSGRELVITLLRSTGLISRNDNPYRQDPAGPQLAIPNAQMRGRWEMNFALYPHSGSWTDGVVDTAERYRHDLLASPGSGAARGEWPPAGAGDSALELAGSNVAISSLRRRADGWLEIRAVNLGDGPVRARIKGTILEAREATLRGEPGEALEVADGSVALDLGPAEIRTLQVRRRETARGQADVLDVAGPRQGG